MNGPRSGSRGYGRTSRSSSRSRMSCKTCFEPHSMASAMLSDALPLRDLLLFTRDGEWGGGASAVGTVEMLEVRGTDFADACRGDISNAPHRWIDATAASRKTLATYDILI